MLLLAGGVEAEAPGKTSKPNVGGVAQWHGPDDYLPDSQFVASTLPGYHSNRRTICRKTKQFIDPEGTRGLAFSMRKLKKGRTNERRPFKIRFWVPDPAGILGCMAEEGQVKLRQSTDRGHSIVAIELMKQVPWYKKLI